MIALQEHDPASAPAFAPGAAVFNAVSSAAASPRLRRVWQLALPDLPQHVEPFPFVP